MSLIEVTKNCFDKLNADGWTIMDPVYLKKLGYDDEFLKSVTKRQYSGKGKYQLYDNNGNPVKYIDGVNYLSFLIKPAHVFDPSFYCDKMGRGFQAQEYYNVIKEGVENGVST